MYVNKYYADIDCNSIDIQFSNLLYTAYKMEM